MLYRGLYSGVEGVFVNGKNRTLPVGDSTVFRGVFAMGGYCINVCKIKEGNKGGYIFVPADTPGVYSLYRFYKWIGLLGGPVGVG